VVNGAASVNGAMFVIEAGPGPAAPLPGMTEQAELPPAPLPSAVPSPEDPPIVLER